MEGLILLQLQAMERVISQKKLPKLWKTYM